MTAPLSEHRFRGIEMAPFWKGLNEIAPATIFPLDVLIETMRSTYDHIRYTLVSAYFYIESE